MKKFLIGMLALGSISVFANSVDHTGRLLNATCNTRYGIGEAQFAVYNKESKSFIKTTLNVVNKDLCEKGNYRASKLVDMSFASIVGGPSVNLHHFRTNSFGIVTHIDEVNADNGALKKVYRKFNLLSLHKYEELDFRIVQLELSGFDQDTIDRIPGFLDMAKMD